MGITNPVLTCSPSIERHHLVMQSAHLPHEAQSISYDFLVITCVNSNARTNVLYDLTTETNFQPLMY